VYFDSNDNGMRDPGEVGIPGVTVELTGTTVLGQPVDPPVVTDALGNFRFFNILPGTYTLTETPPANTIDGRDRVGTLGGVLAPSAITDIPVGPQQAGTLYEFAVLGVSDPNKSMFLSSTDLTQLFGPPGTGVTDVNPGLGDPTTDPPAPALLVEQADPLVLVYAAGSTTPWLTLDPFPGYTGPLSLAEADVTGAGYADIIVGTASQSSHVKVFDGLTGALLESFMAFPGYFGGVTLAAGDTTGAGYADIIVGTASQSSHVKVFDGRTGALVQSFFAFPGYFDGVQVSVGDPTGDGHDDIAVAPVHGSSHVKVFDGQTGALLQSFMAFPGFTGDISLTYVTGTGGQALLYVSTATEGAQVTAFDANDNLAQSFMAYSGWTGGVQLAAGDVAGDGTNELLTLAVGTTHEKAFADGTLTESFLAAPAPGSDLTESLLWFARQQNA
jgi:hypothetical protein